MTTEEDKDTAHCLILLVQGHSRKLADVTTAVYTYSCKTCSRCFPSFQALGGHRASHKKPKLVTTSDTVQPRRLRAHECSVCGSDFASGQALGGHMTRHRPVGTAVPDHPRNALSAFDLNLPTIAGRWPR